MNIDISIEITLYLRSTDVARCTQVCKDWHLFFNCRLYRTIPPTRHPKDKNDSRTPPLDSMRLYAQHIRSLKVKLPCSSYLQNIIPLVHNLTEITIESSHQVQLDDIKPDINLIRSRDLLDSNPKIRKLFLSSFNDSIETTFMLTLLPRSCPELEELSLTTMIIYPEDLVLSVLQGCTRLRFLSIDCCRLLESVETHRSGGYGSMQGQGLHFPSPPAPFSTNIRALQVLESTGFDLMDIHRLMVLCPQLESLMIRPQASRNARSVKPKFDWSCLRGPCSLLHSIAILYPILEASDILQILDRSTSSSTNYIHNDNHCYHNSFPSSSPSSSSSTFPPLTRLHLWKGHMDRSVFDALTSNFKTLTVFGMDAVTEPWMGARILLLCPNLTEISLPELTVDDLVIDVTSDGDQVRTDSKETSSKVEVMGPENCSARNGDNSQSIASQGHHRRDQWPCVGLKSISLQSLQLSKDRKRNGQFMERIMVLRRLETVRIGNVDTQGSLPKITATMENDASFLSTRTLWGITGAFDREMIEKSPQLTWMVRTWPGICDFALGTRDKSLIMRHSTRTRAPVFGLSY